MSEKACGVTLLELHEQGKSNLIEWIRRLRHWENSLKNMDTMVFMYAIPDPDNPDCHISMPRTSEQKCAKACLAAVRREIKECQANLATCERLIEQEKAKET